MMGELVLSERAKEDILEIWSYIAADSVDAASVLVREIRSKLAALLETPYLGRVRSELGKDIRSLTVGNYLILYQAVKGGIYVARVVHGARHLPGLF
jgi:toxin ParE1/3/4